MKRFLFSPVGVVCSSLVVLAITAVTMLGLPDIKIDNDVRTMAPADDPTLLYCDQVDEIFGSAEAMIIAFEAPSGMDTAMVTLLRGVTAALEAEFEDVQSLANTDSIMARDGMLVPESLLDEGPITSGTVAALLARVGDWPLFRNMLISESGRVPSIIIQVPVSLSIEEQEAFLSKAQAIAEGQARDSGIADLTVHVAGEPVITMEIGKQVNHDLSVLSPLALLVVMVILMFSLRSVAGVVGPLLTVAIASAASFGLMGLFHRPVMVITSSIPVFLVAVGSAYGIHMVAHFRNARASGLGRMDSIRKTIRDVGGAVITAAVTTSAGFLSLATSNIVPIKDFGIFLAFGVFIALLASLTLVPLILLIGRSGSLPANKTGKDYEDTRFSRILGRVAATSARHRGLVLGAASLASVIWIVVSLTGLKVDMNSVALFPRESRVRTTDDFFSADFGGTHTLSVVVEGKEPGTMKDPAILNFLVGLQAELEKDPVVGKTISLADFIRRMHQVMNQGDPAFYGIPDSRNLVAQYIQLYEMSGDPDAFENVVDFDYKMGHMLVQVRTGSSIVAEKLTALVQAYSDKNLPEGYTLNTGGTLVRYLVVNDAIVSSQLQSLALSLLMVFVMVAILFYTSAARGRRSLVRALGAGALTLVPILAAVLTNFGVMTLADVPLDAGTTIIAACAVGIGIDYSVHYLHRYQQLLDSGERPLEALDHTARITGRPIIFNAAAVSAGFLTLLASDFLSIRALAWLTALIMVVTSLAAITILPALLSLRDGR